MNPILDKCPVCAGKMMIKELECRECHTKVISQFENIENPLPEIDRDILDFIKVFIFAEGSIKQSEKMLNCSYPKIKNLLKKAKQALGIAEKVKNGTERVIDQLDKGEIDINEALKQIKGESK